MRTLRVLISLFLLLHDEVCSFIEKGELEVELAVAGGRAGA